MSKKNRGKINPNKFNYNLQSILPLMLTVAIIPLIVRLKIVSLPEVSQILNNRQALSGDFFSYYKMIYFIILATVGAIIFSYKYFYKKDIALKKTNIYYPMAAYVIFVMLSTIFATYGDVAVSGYTERYEGMYVLLGYMTCVFLAINLVDNEKQIKYILLALGVSSILLSLLGISQMVGKDFFSTNFGQSLMIPSKYKEMVKSIDFTFGAAKTIYGTLYNTNYVGVYMSMVFSLACTILILSKEAKIKIISGIVSILSFINLLGSASKTGMISIALYILLLIIFFRIQIFKRWKISILVISLFTILAYGFNHYNDDFLKKRIISIRNILTTTEESNLKDIKLENNLARILVDDYEIKIVFGSNGFAFFDKDNQSLDTRYNDEKSRYTFIKEPYNKNVFQLVNYNENLVLSSWILTNKGWSIFYLAVNSEGQFRVLTPSGESIRDGKAPYWGFEGREGFASGRGYIWSRSIPLLKDTVFIGHGPDTYALYFPQDDYLGKLQSGQLIQAVVDKPHNIYLQTAINTGILSLISTIAIFVIYIGSSIKVYIKKKEYNNLLEIAGISIFFAICSYLMMGFLNDSVVSVAPVFWTLLGTGISINMRLRKDMETN